MIEIRNKENKRTTINLMSGTIDLLARSTAVISDEDFPSSHLQNLIRSGKVIVASRTEEKPAKKVSPGTGGKFKEEAIEPEEKITEEESGGQEEPQTEPEGSEPEVTPESEEPSEIENEPKKHKRKSQKSKTY